MESRNVVAGRQVRVGAGDECAQSMRPDRTCAEDEEVVDGSARGTHGRSSLRVRRRGRGRGLAL